MTTSVRTIALSISALTGVLSIPSLLTAQTIEVLAVEETFISTVVDLPFNPETDYSTQRPAQREQSREPYDDSRFVIGADERQPVLSRAFPWSAIGRLELQDASGAIQSTCTGTLIAPDLVLTNAHCLEQSYLDPVTNQPSSAFISTERYQEQQAAEAAPKLVFKPSMIDGVSLDEASVTSYRAGWRENSTNPTADDWAVLKLDKDLGDDYGFLGWRSLDLGDRAIVERLAENALLVGYSGDFPTTRLSQFGAPSETAGIDEYCSIVGTFLEGYFVDTLIHDCDATPGSSGGPILAQFSDGDFYMIGLNAYQTDIPEPYMFPDGTVTSATNAGVQPSRWSAAAVEMSADR